MFDSDRYQLVAADRLPIATVWRAFVDGFQGYMVPMRIDEPAFVRMLTVEGADLSASVVALDPHDAPAGVAILAVRDRRSWCGGLGVIPSARRHGLGRRLMRALIGEARRRDVETLELECIDGNTAARALYDGLGFRAKRRLDIFDGPIAPIASAAGRSPGWRVPDPTSMWDDFSLYHGGPRAWQLDEPALRVSAADAEIEGIAIGDHQQPQGYVLYRPARELGGRISLLDAGSLRAIANPEQLLAELVVEVARANPESSIAAANIAEDEPLNGALRALGVAVRLSQTEMALPLR